MYLIIRLTLAQVFILEVDKLVRVSSGVNFEAVRLFEDKIVPVKLNESYNWTTNILQTRENSLLSPIGSKVKIY